MFRLLDLGPLSPDRTHLPRLVGRREVRALDRARELIDPFREHIRPLPVAKPQDSELLAALKGVETAHLRLPRRPEDWLDPTHLGRRFARFRIFNA